MRHWMLVWLSLALVACETERSPQPPADAGADSQPPVAGRAAPERSAVGACLEEGRDSAVWIASATLGAAAPRLELGVELRGDAVSALFQPQQGVANGLRWPAERLYLLRDNGFWDIDLEGSARWYATSTLLLGGIREGDVDGDGDRDVMLLSMVPDASGIAMRLSIWERTRDGLAERTEVLRTPGIILFMPYLFGDADGDGDLDILAYERATPIAYSNDGAFGFTRSVRGETAAEQESKLSAAFDFSDRNGDGRGDLLVGAGEALDLQLFVLLQDGTGSFSLPGPIARETAPLVSHGPMAYGIGIEDVTGDGLTDWVSQDPEASQPRLRLRASVDATTFAPLEYIDGLGFEFADVDEDGRSDLLTTRGGKLYALSARAGRAFEARDLGLDLAAPEVMDFVVDPGVGAAPARIHVLYELPCRTCDAGCSGQCRFGSCIEP
ncbi:MAG TPA: VCBS repeat-containing protein [Polyangiales bacterium]|nr:VCBS repeat-containing protein [Polyangiales bacterium]